MEFIDEYHLRNCLLCSLARRDGKLISRQPGKPESSDRRSEGSEEFGTDWPKDRDAKQEQRPAGGSVSLHTSTVQMAAVVPLRLAGPGAGRRTPGPEFDDRTDLVWRGVSGSSTVQVAAEGTARAMATPILVDCPG